MPRLSNKRRAAFARWRTISMANESTATPLPVLLPMKAEPGPEPLRPSLELSVEDELESSVETDIKQEPLEVEQDEQLMLLQDEMKVEVDLCNSCPAEEELDPFGQAAYQKMFQEIGENQQDQIRCLFCLKQFRDGSDRGAITQSKVEFVLGLRELGIPGTQPACCEGCRKMFELFYEFKRSCLVALARPAELLVWAEASKKAAKFVDSKPNIGRKARMMESKSQRPPLSKMKDVQQAEGSDGLDEGSKQKSLEMLKPSTETLPKKIKQDIEKPSLECEICMEKFSDRMVLKKHWLNHFFTSPSKTVTKPTVPERLTDLPISSTDSDIPAPEPDPSIVPEKSTDLPPSSAADLDFPAPNPDPSTALGEDEDQKKTYCFRCRKWFSTRTIYIHHKPFCIKSRVRKNPEPSFLCSLCPQKFRREQDLTFHINKHNGVRTVPCRREGCTKMFFTMRTRYEHEKCCGPSAQLICNVCGSLFRSEGGLRVHLYTHEDPKFSCELCNKAFYSRSNLKKHAATHSEERKFQCKVCGKRFKSYEANRVHQRIHTQEKPYACHICGLRFMYNCLLKTHLEKGHDPEGPMHHPV